MLISYKEIKGEVEIEGWSNSFTYALSLGGLARKQEMASEASEFVFVLMQNETDLSTLAAKMNETD